MNLTQRITALSALVLCSVLPVSAALSPERVPTFKVRARIAASTATKPGTLSTFQIGSSPVLKTNLGAWSGWLSFDRAEVEKNLKGYPAMYMNDFPIVTHLRVTPVAESTVVEAELVFDEGQKSYALKGDLFGPNLGILIWRDRENQPQASTMAEYNRRYWQPLATMQTLARRPRLFPIIDRFIGGDDDRLSWQQGIQELAKAGFNALMLPPS